MHAETKDDRFDLLVLAWLASQRAKPTKSAALSKGLAKSLPVSDAATVEHALTRLVAAGRVERVAPQQRKTIKRPPEPAYRITAEGEVATRDFLGRHDLPAGAAGFKQVVTIQVPAIALNISAPKTKTTAAAFAKVLQVSLCVRTFGLDVSLDRGTEQAKLDLVRLALLCLSNVPVERIFLKTLPKTNELPALVVAPLLNQGGTAASSLDKLIEATALRIAGVSKSDQLAPAIVSGWLQGKSYGRTRVEETDEPKSKAPPPAPPDVDLPTFARQALAAAREVARAGRDGVSNLGDKVLVHFAWRRYQQSFGPIPLDRFKRRLSEANGEHIVLVREDLVPEARAEEFRESEVRTGASSYHYVRI